jgi:hypothetical protein
VVSLFVEFCVFHRSLVAMYLAEPSTRLVPDFVMTFTTAPTARPCSAETPDVKIATSSMPSKLRFDPNVPVVGSVVLTPSNMKRLLLVSAPCALTLPTPTTPGARPISVWKVRPTGSFWNSSARTRVCTATFVLSTIGVSPTTVTSTSCVAIFSVTGTLVVFSFSTELPVRTLVSKP